ncbi:hypothetical protein NLJ89_g11388 [Agrocybe chaxingu]|uniref:FAD-binding PCMH-type domain-containing protein n=1 Tax=Agrocybe chaxingu TaxID=84603 RepID=A0A9W8JNU6_9AGAR|nr:hypothetical protein NLJ89_g11388 [Agrocybe chaxingu]
MTNSELSPSKHPLCFKGDLITPDHPEYATAIDRWAANTVRKAKIVAFVKDSEDVAYALKLAKDNRLPIAIRGGGRHAFGASSVEGGLVIDPSRYMNGVRVDPSNKLGYVGGGAIWETVFREGMKYGLGAVGGAVNHTGVGGYILGGGYGWLTSAYGLAADSLVQATIVTANGSVLTVNDTEHSDLYFALCGGGGNFGVVTEFVLQLHPQRPTVYSGALVYLVSATESIIEATHKWQGITDGKDSAIEVATIDDQGNAVFIVSPFYNGTEAEGRERFKGLLAAGPVSDTTKEISFEELNTLQNPVTPSGKAAFMKGAAFKRLHAPSVIKAHQRLVEIIKGGVYKGLKYPLRVFGLKKVNSIPAQSTAFRRVASHNITVYLTWDPKEDRTEEAMKLVEELCAIASEGQEGLTDSERLGYTNYEPDSADSDKAKLVFGKNYARLQAIKKRYDPDNIFNKWFPITPAA